MEKERVGRYQITKAHIEGRRYRAIVLDMSIHRPPDERPAGEGPHPKVFAASREGWSEETRQECRRFIERLDDVTQAGEEFQAARSGFHRAIENARGAGGTLRVIGDAADLSKDRIAQILKLGEAR